MAHGSSSHALRATLVLDDAEAHASPAVQLAPLTDLRVSPLVRTGALTTLERLQHDSTLDVRGVLVPSGAAELTRERANLPVNEPPTDVPSVLLVNGRCPLLPARAMQLGVGEALAERASGHLIAAHVRSEDAARTFSAWAAPSGLQVAQHEGQALMYRPWHVRSFRDACLAHDLPLLAKFLRALGTRDAGPATVIGDASHVSVHASAKIYPGVLLDVEHGPIVMDEGATIRPGAMLLGPCYVGPHSTVLERATIRPGTAIGPWCKVNGEVGGTIFQGYANKAHDGYLGDSFLGEWVNLGAGTTNSNLLNTYAETIARATPDGKHERTGEQFLGAIVGDHVKTAICTRIMTASVLHTGSMFATTAAVSGTVRGFTWATDAGEKAYRWEKFEDVMRAAMARRKLTPGPAYLARVRALAHAAWAT
jgi:UDP-N-acetylglucosamine diphosphorylase / glucose-1-phosphate thymidylyltransferase / UDP-N-acetylgalactosamine diphosphorylase / glucosamine-1-phosphate N-acetyltransferase / galactosamine-1-phosphate N-acetyltransferase